MILKYNLRRLAFTFPKYSFQTQKKRKQEFVLSIAFGSEIKRKQLFRNCSLAMGVKILIVGSLTSCLLVEL